MKNLAFAVMLVCSPALPGFANDAQSTWTGKCAKCHGAEGKGDTKMGRILHLMDYSDAKVQAGFTDEQAFKALKEGIKDKAGSTRMMAVEGLSDDEIHGLVAYVRSLKK
jgi:cytochrome c553